MVNLRTGLFHVSSRRLHASRLQAGEEAIASVHFGAGFIHPQTMETRRGPGESALRAFVRVETNASSALAHLDFGFVLNDHPDSTRCIASFSLKE